MKCVGLGRFIKDPILQELDINNTKVKICQFLLLVSEKRQSNSSIIDEDVYSFTVWDSAAEYIANNAKQGDMIYYEAVPKKRKTQEEGETKPRINISFRINSFRLL